eukprot:CAMPEP_0206219902 /NCGR_PEP_ID=MMETSP0047_2-20121206/4571_1 /ASSEMBLY_ACC=CAM_ASM_000192 /TAXON_ID=195065 /ORGANISM="Chroomonas mesostigmatica_cf, Strain CCMP1168" /LENGTH=213 /DNA_ID=CAMNT_0053642485 /DNA_START=167 /DNA_END=808 /DNA_ORIENTATION=-
MASLASTFLRAATKAPVPLARTYMARRPPAYDGRTPNSVEYEETYLFRPNRERQNFVVRQPSSYANQLCGVPANSLAEPEPHELAVRRAALTARRPSRRPATAPLLRAHYLSNYDGRTPTSVNYEDMRSRGFHTPAASSTPANDTHTPSPAEYEDMLFRHAPVHKPAGVRGYPRPSGYDGRNPTSVEYEEAHDGTEGRGGAPGSKPQGKASSA